MSDPKLLQAMEKIKQVLDDADIAGHVVLHNAPGKFEILTKLDPSYSKLIGLPPAVRLRSKLADYEGDVDRQRADLEATASMVGGLGELMGKSALSFILLSEWIDANTGAEHGPMERDGGTEAR